MFSRSYLKLTKENNNEKFNVLSLFLSHVLGSKLNASFLQHFILFLLEAISIFVMCCCKSCFSHIWHNIWPSPFKYKFFTFKIILLIVCSSSFPMEISYTNCGYLFSIFADICLSFFMNHVLDSEWLQT